MFELFQKLNLQIYARQFLTSKLFHFYLSFWIWKVWKGREKITKNWISREWKELFRWNKKHFHRFWRVIIWWKNKNLIKIANTNFKYGVILIIKHTIIHFIIELKLFNNAAVAETTAIKTSAIILGIFGIPPGKAINVGQETLFLFFQVSKANLISFFIVSLHLAKVKHLVTRIFKFLYSDELYFFVTPSSDCWYMYMPSYMLIVFLLSMFWGT